MSKIVILAAGAVGYVFGTKAGRERYEQIKDQATKIRSNPTVRKAAADAQDAVAQQAPVVKEKVANASGKGSSTSDSAAGQGSSSTAASGSASGAKSAAGSAQRPAGQPGPTGGPAGA